MEFDQIVAPPVTEAFLRNYWLKSFVHFQGEPCRFSELLTWDELPLARYQS
jgi:hypothetical protein